VHKYTEHFDSWALQREEKGVKSRKRPWNAFTNEPLTVFSYQKHLASRVNPSCKGSVRRLRRVKSLVRWSLGTMQSFPEAKWHEFSNSEIDQLQNKRHWYTLLWQDTLPRNVSLIYCDIIDSSGLTPSQYAPCRWLCDRCELEPSPSMDPSRPA